MRNFTSFYHIVNESFNLIDMSVQVVICNPWFITDTYLLCAVINWEVAEYEIFESLSYPWPMKQAKLYKLINLIFPTSSWEQL